MVSAEELYRLAGEQLLARGVVEIPISGGSMLPTLRPDRDRVRLERRDFYRKGDIVLACAQYPGGEGIFLHRVVATDGDRVILMGDANLQQRERCLQSQIHGSVAAIISSRGEHAPSPLPLRMKIRRLLHKIKNFQKLSSIS